MRTTMPITDAVYGRRSTARKPKPTAHRRPAEALVRDRLQPELIAEIERRFGLKRRGKRGGHS